MKADGGMLGHCDTLDHASECTVLHAESHSITVLHHHTNTTNNLITSDSYWASESLISHDHCRMHEIL